MTLGTRHSANSQIIDLFREWDDDNSGTVSKQEFRKAMALLGLEVLASRLSPPRAPPRVHPTHTPPSPHLTRECVHACEAALLA